MKKYIFPSVVILMVILVALSFYYKNNNSTGKQAQVVNKTQTNKSSNPIKFNFANKDKTLSVNDIQSDPSAYKGTITINGVMAGVAKDDSKVFAIVDTAEVKACQSVGCGTFYLLVKYNGKLPNLGDEVNVTGSFTGSGDNLIFNATEFKTLGNIIPKGGQ